ncbi:MAG: hypothetical protein AAFR61_03210 [Bacteroidota bacterium]
MTTYETFLSHIGKNLLYLGMGYGGQKKAYQLPNKARYAKRVNNKPGLAILIQKFDRFRQLYL